LRTVFARRGNRRRNREFKGRLLRRARDVEKLPVLVVEDESLLQQMLQDALEEAGFAVTLSTSGEDAIAHLERQDPAFVALVTDINLSPTGLTGWDVARRARELDGVLPVVYSTGAEGADWPSNGVPNSILITKPFAPAQIVTAVAQLLNTGSAPATGP
jgi:CheY-like chemotaxis protein